MPSLMWINTGPDEAADLIEASCCGSMRAIEMRRECSYPQSESTRMFKISLLVWIILGTALAGSAVISVLPVPSLAAEAMKNIPFAVLIGFAAAMPLSYLVARKIGASATR
jgi:hypothetical protein